MELARYIGRQGGNCCRFKKNSLGYYSYLRASYAHKSPINLHEKHMDLSQVNLRPKGQDIYRRVASAAGTL